MPPTTQKLFIASIIIFSLSVAFGAIGSHVIQKRVTSEDLKIYEIGVRYLQLASVAAIGFVSSSMNFVNTKIHSSTLMLLLGAVVFFTTLFILSISENVFGERWSFLGAVTPIGGALMIFSGFWYVSGFKTRK